MLEKFLLAAASAAAFSFGVAHAQVPPATQLWFQPTQDWNDAKYPSKNQDYTQLFSNPYLWPTTYSHINYFGMNDRFAGSGPSNELAVAFSFLKGHNIPLRVTFQMVDAWLTGCGSGIEGMLGNSSDLAARVSHIKQAGGVVALISTDEPLFFGHYYTGSGACKFTLAQIAQQVSDNVKEIRQTFPNAVFVDEEPTDTYKYAKSGEIAQFYSLLAQHGTPVQSVTLDVQWHRNGWDTRSKQFVADLAASSIKYNIFADSWNVITNGAQWDQDAIQNMIAWAKIIATPPQALVVASWDQAPTHILPETDNSSLSYVSAYLASILGLPALR